MAAVFAVPYGFDDLRLLCSAACQQNPVEFKNTEVVASILLDNINLMAGDRDQRDEAHIILNSHMENFQDVIDEQEELDERIAFGMSVTHEDTNDGGREYEPILKGRSPIYSDFVTDAVAAAKATTDADTRAAAVVAAAAAADAGARAAAAAAAAAITPILVFTTNKYSTLISFVSIFEPGFKAVLNQHITALHQSLVGVCTAGDARAFVYNNIIFFTQNALPDNSKFPRYSFNILCPQNSFLLPRLLVLGERGIGKILENFICRGLPERLKEFERNNTIGFKIINPTDTNKLWQVKICLFGNEFTFISIQIISMNNGFFDVRDLTPNNNDVDLCALSNLCFSLYNKCLSKDFNCLCSLSEFDIKLFQYIFITHNNRLLVTFQNFIIPFLNNLSETQLNVKKQYFIMGLYNLASCLHNPNYTPETKAYELLFNQNPDGIDLFYRSMSLIKRLNQQIAPIFPEQIRFAMGGGKLYSIFQQALNTLIMSNQVFFHTHIVSVINALYPDNPDNPSNIVQRQKLTIELQHASVKAAADADFSCFYPEELIAPEGRIAAEGLGASSCMAISMLLQLSLKELIDTLFAPPAPAAAPAPPAPPAENGWNTSEIDIGNSCIGTPPTTLSSLRIVLKNISRFYLINSADEARALAILEWLSNFVLVDEANIKATISPYDFVMKGSLILYIMHIIDAVQSYESIIIIGNQDAINITIRNVAEFLSTYCMITDEGFSSPIKGILDIFYTLFIIENFANRTFVTQKINKELKRVAICAQILLLHYNELPRNELTQQILLILTRMIGYGYDHELLGPRLNEIMVTYVDFVRKLIYIYTTDVNFLYFSVPIDRVRRSLPDRLTRQNLTSIETTFMQLLPERAHDNLPVFEQTIQQYIPVITALTTMREATNDLYLNKMYASCRDAENKKNGIVAIMSAYQSYLWDRGKINMITRDEANDKCGYILEQDQRRIIRAEGIIQHLQNDRNVFNELIDIINGFAITDVLGMMPSIRQITRDDILHSHPAPPDDRNGRLNRFLVFSWFITSVFGVKTKSKPSKVISLGRTYLQLLISNPPAVPPALPPAVPPAVPPEEPRLRQYPLFGLLINIPDAGEAGEAGLMAVAAAALAPVAGAAQPIIDPIKVHELRGAYVLTITIVQAQANRLCLAYSEFNIKDAISKYIRKDIDFNVAADAGYNPLRAMQDVKKIETMNILSIDVNSLVFNQEIFSELIIRFSHLPRGNQFILNAAQYMRPIMRRICFLIDARQQANIRATMDEIRNFYPYRPTPHDVSKFTILDDGMRNAWLQYLINKIFGVGGVDPQTIFDNMKLFVLLYNYIGPVNEQIIFPNPAPNPARNYLDVVGRLIDEHYAGCQTQNADLLRLSLLWNSQEPRVIAAPALKSGFDAKTRQEYIQAVAAKGDTSATQTNPVKKATGNRPTSGSRAAEVNAVKRATNINVQQRKGGNKPNNHTRRNKNNRKKNSKTKTKTKTKAKSSTKYKKKIPSSRSGSQSNRKKSKPKKSQKNVTFKRRRARK